MPKAAPEVTRMKRTLNIRHRQKGSFLIEGLLAIVIFSVGIIALMGLQAVSIKNVTESNYRSTAALLANKLVGQLWVANVDDATVQTSYNTGGTAYNQWAAEVAKGLPNATGVSAPAVVLANRSATITLFWQVPGQPQHNFVVTTVIGRN
jgi:type IV pilus assembly protein PilV